MQNFTYHNPVKIVFGKGTIAELKDLIPSGQKVLMIDADLRRPMLQRVFNIERSKGLSTELAGEMSLDDAMV